MTTHYSSEIEPYQSTRTQFEAARSALDAALKTEETARILADSTEQAARIAAATSLDGRLDIVEPKVGTLENNVADILEELQDARFGESSLEVVLNYLRNGLANVTGGADISDTKLKEWASRVYDFMESITYHATYTRAVATATVVWPDGSTGTFTATTTNATWQTVDAYTVTHIDSDKIVTQPLMTRNSNGDVTSKPALTVGVIP